MRVLVVVVAMVSVACGSRDLPREPQEAEIRIVQALEDYQQQEGRFPADLEELVPDYLSESELMVSGELPWYMAGQDGLWFDIEIGLSDCAYQHSSGWECGTGGAE